MEEQRMYLDIEESKNIYVNKKPEISEEKIRRGQESK